MNYMYYYCANYDHFESDSMVTTNICIMYLEYYACITPKAKIIQ